MSPRAFNDVVTICDTADTAAQQQYDQAHGRGAMRGWWFLRGYHEGAAACLAGP